jgi:hypothetical protein
MPEDHIETRDKLRRLSNSRQEAGLPPFPTVGEIESCSIERNISKVEAHDWLMRIGERKNEE